jgi:ADP-heptose:LPS heptosyltransferase
VERNLALVGAFLGRPLSYVSVDMPPQAEAGLAVDAALRRAGLPDRSFLVLHPGTSGFGSFKRWPAGRFGELARLRAQEGVAVAVTFAPSERALAEEVVRASGGRAVPLESPDLTFLAEVLRRSRGLVAADTGPLHLAALLGVPLLGLFGPKDPAVYGPYGRRADGTVGPLPVLVREDVACRPCRLRRCADPICMRTISPSEVQSRGP